MNHPLPSRAANQPASAFRTAAERILLLADRPERAAALARALGRIAPCTVATPDLSGADVSGADVPVAWLGIVAAVDLLQPQAVRALRERVKALGPGVPLICLMPSTGVRASAEARGLGASLCLPRETAPGTVAEALLALLAPGRSTVQALVSRSAERAGAVITGLLDAARASGRVDAAVVDEGLDPILNAVGDGGLSTWLDTVRGYDDATYQHCLLVAGLAATFAIALGFAEGDRQQLVRAALLHDVGKARIPLAILNKGGPLDAWEQTVMRDHPAFGHEILVAAGGFDPTVLAVVRHHHELLDGSGYPDGLAGAQIGDWVRLITICDIYAALAERRPYREPMPSALAVGILRGMGPKLDQPLVEAFARTVAGS